MRGTGRAAIDALFSMLIVTGALAIVMPFVSDTWGAGNHPQLVAAFVIGFLLLCFAYNLFVARRKGGTSTGRGR